jgi:hypothetical protein
MPLRFGSKSGVRSDFMDAILSAGPHGLWKRKRIGLAVIFLALCPALRATTANPVALSGITVSGTTATVTTSAAHGLSATLPSAFCITGSAVSADNVCGVVSSAGTATTFTFNFPSSWAVVACATSCGSVTPAPRWIVLTTDSNSSPGNLIVTYLLWIAVSNPAPHSGSSLWTAQGISAGATSAENNAIGAGYIKELTGQLVRPVGTSAASIETDLDTIWTNAQNNQTVGTQPMAYYGYVWDGTGVGQE